MTCAPGSTCSTPPAIVHPDVGWHATVTATGAPLDTRGTLTTFAPTCKAGGCQPPTTRVRAGAGVAAAAGALDWRAAGSRTTGEVLDARGELDACMLLDARGAGTDPGSAPGPGAGEAALTDATGVGVSTLGDGDGTAVAGWAASGSGRADTVVASGGGAGGSGVGSPTPTTGDATCPPGAGDAVCAG